MKEVKIEVLGSDPPCSRCRMTEKVVREVAKRLTSGQRKFEIEERAANSKEAKAKYGALTTPAIAIDGTVKLQGRLPSAPEVETLLLKAFDTEE